MKKTKKTWWRDQEPPEHLSERSRELWRHLVGRRVKSPERLVLLRMALEVLDEADSAREALAAGELLEKAEGSKMAHANPLLAVERQARAQFAKLWKTLALDFDSGLDGGGDMYGL
jgi:hypothetical protein